MKKIPCIIIQLLLIVISGNAQEIEMLTFEGKFSIQAVVGPNIVKTESKQLHLKSNKSAHIVPVYDGAQMKNFHPFAGKIIDQAIGKWEKKINVPFNKKIEITFLLNDNLNDTQAYTAVVPFIRYDDIMYPLPLAMADFDYNPSTEVKIVVNINSNPAKWYFEGDGDEPIVGQYDFETGVLRALSNCFGFGSSLTGSSPTIKSTFNIFDQFIVNSNNERLIDIPKNDAGALYSYVTENNISWENGNTSYGLYSRKPYNQYMTLKYFDPSENELMCSEFKEQTGYRNIDSKVTKIMEDIGWGISPETSLSIKSSNIDNITGLGNVNSSYSFYAESSVAASNLSWKYIVRKKDNGYETIQTGNTATFTINPLIVKDYYYRDESGDFCGKIILTATVNGASETTEFNVWLEAKPGDIEYEIKIIKESPYYYNLEVIVSSLGAKDLIVTLSADGEQLSEVFENKQFTKFSRKYLYYDSPVEIEFTSRNDYGETYNSYYTDGVGGSALINDNNKEVVSQEIFSLTGVSEARLKADESIDSVDIPSGFHIVKIAYSDGTFATQKVYKK